MTFPNEAQWLTVDIEGVEGAVTLQDVELLGILIHHQPIFGLRIIKPTINNIFLVFWITHFFLHNYNLALKKMKRLNTEVWTC